jgi:hypothetical protein
MNVGAIGLHQRVIVAPGLTRGPALLLPAHPAGWCDGTRWLGLHHGGSLSRRDWKFALIEADNPDWRDLWDTWFAADGARE